MHNILSLLTNVNRPSIVTKALMGSIGKDNRRPLTTSHFSTANESPLLVPSLMAKNAKMRLPSEEKPVSKKRWFRHARPLPNVEHPQGIHFAGASRFQR